ncbi:MAG: electron transfer flavoprotein subunit beta/FixA family protein [Lachnospiraceae bacterium]|nr:electron transfer flavoprotein subunit beta/FixA family protein [Lachnospiraceae bacterium]
MEPDLDILPEKEWQPDKDLRVETAFLPSIWNCFDESALAMALRLHKENEDISLSALTIAPPAGETAMRTLYALGFDNCARLDPGGADLRFAPEWAAELICRYCERAGGFDVLLFGQQSAEGNNSLTPALCAEKLHVPCISQVTELHCEKGKKLSVSCACSQGLVRRQASAPLVLSVGNAQISCLPAPTLKAKMTLGKKPVKRLVYEDLGLTEASMGGYTGLKLTGLEPVSLKRAARRITGATPTEIAKKLYNEYIKKALEEGQ